MSNDRNRRWWTYSLRTFLFVLLLVGVALGWLGMKMERARQQKVAVAAIVRADGIVTYDFNSIPGSLKAVPFWTYYPSKWFGIDFVFDAISVEFAPHMGPDFGPFRRGQPLASPIDVTPNPTSEDLEQLAALPNLKRLVIVEGDKPIPLDGLEVLGRLRKLEELGLITSTLDDEALAHIGTLRELQLLHISGGSARHEHPEDYRNLHVNDDHLRHLAGLTSLRILSLPETGIRGDGLRHVSGLNQLQRLRLDGTNITDDSLRHLASLTALEELYLSRTNIDGNGLVHLKGCTSLRVIELSETQVNDLSLATLRHFRELREIGLSGTAVGDEGLRHLAELEHVVDLSLSKTRITSDGLRHLANFKALQFLDISETEVDDLSAIRNLPALKFVGVSQGQLSESDQAWVDAINTPDPNLPDDLPPLPEELDIGLDP